MEEDFNFEVLFHLDRASRHRFIRNALTTSALILGVGTILAYLEPPLVAAWGFQAYAWLWIPIAGAGFVLVLVVLLDREIPSVKQAKLDDTEIEIIFQDGKVGVQRWDDPGLSLTIASDAAGREVCSLSWVSGDGMNAMVSTACGDSIVSRARSLGLEVTRKEGEEQTGNPASLGRTTTIQSASTRASQANPVAPLVAPLHSSSDLPRAAVTHFDLSSDVALLDASRHSMYIRMLVIWTMFFVILLAAGLGSGHLPIAIRIVKATLFALALSSIVGVPYLVYALVQRSHRPIQDLEFEASGFSVTSRHGSVGRYDWAEPKLNLHLWRVIGWGEVDPVHQTGAHWNLRFDPPRVYGLIPQDCYERFLGAAQQKGLIVKQEQIMHPRKTGSYQTQETFLRREFTGWDDALLTLKKVV